MSLVTAYKAVRTNEEATQINRWLENQDLEPAVRKMERDGKTFYTVYVQESAESKEDEEISQRSLSQLSWKGQPFTVRVTGGSNRAQAIKGEAKGEKLLEYRKKWEQTPKAKEYKRGYRKTEVFKQAQTKFRKSDKGVEARKKYEQGTGKAARDKYQKSEKAKARRKEYQERMAALRRQIKESGIRLGPNGEVIKGDI